MEIERAKFIAEANEKQQRYLDTILPRMRAVQAYYAERHGLGSVGNGNTSTPR